MTDQQFDVLCEHLKTIVLLLDTLIGAVEGDDQDDDSPTVPPTL